MRRGARGSTNLGGMTWQEVLEFNANSTPTKLYPDRDIPLQRSIRPEELLELRFYKEIRTSFLDESAFYIRRNPISVVQRNEDGLVRYSDRNKPKRKNDNLSLSDLDLDPKFFPEELRKTLGAASATGRKKARRKLDMKTFIDFTIKAQDLKDESSEAAHPNVEEEPDEGLEDEDEDFGDDDDNDYGENYFDNGEGDDYDDYDGDEGAIYE